MSYEGFTSFEVLQDIIGKEPIWITKNELSCKETTYKENTPIKVTQIVDNKGTTTLFLKDLDNKEDIIEIETTVDSFSKLFESNQAVSNEYNSFLNTVDDIKKRNKIFLIKFIIFSTIISILVGIICHEIGGFGFSIMTSAILLLDLWIKSIIPANKRKIRRKEKDCHNRCLSLISK